MPTITKSMKYKIEKDKALYAWFNGIQFNFNRIKNKATTMAWDWQQFSFGYKERFSSYPIEKDVIGQSLKQDIYHEVKEWNKGYNSHFCDQAVKEALDKFKEQKRRVLKGEESLASYKKRGAFIIRSSQINALERESEHSFRAKLSLLSPDKAKELGVNTQIEVKLRAGGGATHIMNRVLNDEYKLLDSRISYNEEKKCYFLMITYQFIQAEIITDADCVMGIDLGVNVPATISINNKPHSTRLVGDSEEISNFEKQMYEKRRRLSLSRKWAGEGSVGHGTKTRIRPLDKLGNKIANFKSTKNHLWSRYIVDYAIKNSVGLIQMEDLKGVSENKRFLKRWTYFDLQRKIEGKANEFGIEVIKVPAAHTSARCFYCGAIHQHKHEAKWRPKRDRFKCMNCGHADHADCNASKNLTIKNIGDVIKSERDQWFKTWEKGDNKKARCEPKANIN